MGIVNTALAGASGNQGYFIQRSLRFRSSASAYLQRTPSVAGNQQIHTFSGWIKYSTSSTDRSIISFGNAYTYQIAFQNGGTNLTCGTQQLGVTNPWAVILNNVFRDPSAWYHIVIAIDTTQATATNRVKMYVNGVQQTSFYSATYPTQNYNTGANSTTSHSIGRREDAQQYLDGYLAEVNFIDGQALTPSSFGQTDAVTGVWTPKKYTGTYGTNGFYLDFKDNTSATTLAYDKSGNSNNWTPNNISTTAGATYDSMTDVPTLTSATAANYCTWNPLYYWHDTYLDPCTLTNGNLTASDSGKPWNTIAYGTFGMASGKWYWEITNTTLSDWHKLGIIAADYTQSAPFDNSYTYVSNATKRVLASNTAYGATFATGDIIGLAFDADTGTLTCYKNGVSQGTLSSAIPMTKAYVPYYQSNDVGTNVVDANFGQRPFSYTPPTGFKALNTFNLPDPVIKKPNQYMDATLYTGNAGTKTVTNSGFQPDLVWMKDRTTAYDHVLLDAVRAGTPPLFLSSNTTSAESSTGGGESMTYNSNGFTYFGNNVRINANTDNYVAWQWKKGATPGFDIVTYTGTGSVQNINHSLGVAPKMVIVKSRGAAQPWVVYHSMLNGGSSPANYYMYLNGTAGQAAYAGFFNNTAPTSSVFTVGTDTAVNQSATNLVAYLFAEIPGFSKFGSYTGNGSADGPFVYCGFRPKYVMYKRSDGVGSWAIHDTSRDTFNVSDKYLLAESSGAEGTYSTFDFTSNGFKVRNGAVGLNASGGTYTYAAFAENPFKYSNAR